MSKQILCLALLWFVCGHANIAQAVVLDGDDITATASSTYVSSSNPDLICWPSYTIDESGLNASDQHNVYTDMMWLSTSGGGGSADNNPAGVEGPAWIAYKFDQPYELGATWVWNGNCTTVTDRGLRNVSVHYSVDGCIWTKLGDYEWAQASGVATYAGFSGPNFSNAIARYVVITANSVNGNWGSNYYMLSEIRFNGTATHSPIDANDIIASAPSSYTSPTYGWTYWPQHTVDCNGIDSNDLHDTDSLGMWMSLNPPDGNRSNNPAGIGGPAWIGYEFDKLYEISEMWVWNGNYPGETDRGFNNVRIHYSRNGYRWLELGNGHVFTEAPGTTGYAHGDEIDFDCTKAKYVVITADDPNGNFGDDYYMLSEVRFYGRAVESEILPENIISATASNDNYGKYPAISTINCNGLDTAGCYHSTDSIAMWNAKALSTNGSAFTGTESGPAWIAYEFDQVYDLEEMLVWNGNYCTSSKNYSGRGLRNVTVEYSTNGSSWSTLGSYEFEQASGDENYFGALGCDFNGAQVRYVVITADDPNGNWDPQQSYYMLSEVKFYGSTDYAATPQPAINETGVHIDDILQWSAGVGATSHQVYFGTSYSAMSSATTASAEYKGSQSGLSYDPGTLDENTTYYWRIDEVNGGTTCTGDVWSFTTEFEDYIPAYFVAASACSDTEAAYPASLVADESGLDSTLLLHSADADDMWRVNSTGNSSADPCTTSGPAWIMFEFDRVCELQEMWVWNGNDGATNKNRGLRNVAIEYSMDGNAWTKLGDYEFSQASGSADDPGFQACDFNGIEAKYVVITAGTTNGNWGGGDYYSLSEVRFFGASSSRVKDVLYGVPWTMQYDANNEKPSDSGALIFSDGTTGSMIANGSCPSSATAGSTALNIDTLGENCGCYFDLNTTSNNMDLDSATGYTVQWRVKLNDADADSGSYAMLHCAPEVNKWWRLQLLKHDDKVYAKMHSGDEIELDADADNPEFHVLRVTVLGSLVSLYIDESSTAALTISLVSGGPYPLRFGDLTGTADADFEVDYLYVYDGAAVGPVEFREPAKNRNRRLIYDDDGCPVVYSLADSTAEQLLVHRTTPTKGKILDTYVYCDWSSPLGIFTHNTSVTNAEVFDTRDASHADFSNNRTSDFVSQGTDCLEIMVDYCRKNDLEVWWSMRMNDVHDAWTSNMGSKFKEEHPDYLFSTEGNNPENGYWSGIDYTEADVRQLVLDSVEEICQNYDIDGVVLDYFRHPVFFQSHADGNDVSSSELQLMTDLIEDIRAVADREGLKRGKPILVIAATPDHDEYCEAIGLDINSWMDNDLIDIWVPVCDYRLNHWEWSVDHGHLYDVPVYPRICNSWISDTEAIALRDGAYGYRGRANCIWDAGADGVYLFNYFTSSNFWLFDDYGDYNTLQTRTSIYTTSYLSYFRLDQYYTGGKDLWMEYDWVAPGSYDKRLTVTDSAVETLDIQIGQDCSSGTPDVSLHVRIDDLANDLESDSDLTVKWEGYTLTGNRRIDLNSTTGYTVEWCVKMLDADADSGAYAWLYCAPDSSSFWRLELLRHDGKVYTKLHNGSEIELDSDADNPDFHTLRVTVSSGNASLYIDGSSTASVTTALTSGGPYPLRFGDMTGSGDADAKYVVDYMYAYDDGAVAGGTNPEWTVRYTGGTPWGAWGCLYSDGSYGRMVPGGSNSTSGVVTMFTDGTMQIDTTGRDISCYFSMETDQYIKYPINTNYVEKGWNTIEFDLATGKSDITIEDLHVLVDY